MSSIRKCEWCDAEIGQTVFTAYIEGSEKSLCRTCFFLHLKGEDDKIIQRVMGFSGSDELFTLDPQP